MKTMKALVKHAYGPNNMELRELPVPEPLPGEVRIEVKAVGICGTDLKIREDQFIYVPPVILGHEFSGVIDKAGAAVKGWVTGERVVSEQHTGACGLCAYCLTGKRHYCVHKKSPGYMIDGAFARYICVQASLLHRIPEGVSFEEACVVEPMAVAAHGILQRSGVNPEDFVVILGCGSIALLALQLVKAQGASRVMLTGIEVDAKKRFGIAQKLGADLLVNTEREDPVQVVLNETGHLGADLVVDLAGAAEPILQGLEMLRKEGRFCALGLPHGDVPVPWTKTVLKAVDINFSFSSGFASWEKCLAMVASKKVLLDEYVAYRYPLREWREAFEKAKSGDALKVIINP